MTNEQLETLKKAAQAATPQNLDSAEIINREPGLVDCPTCGGDGYAQFHADFCNYDGHALGVQFYGIGPEHKAAEAYFRAASPATILALIERVELLEAGKADLLTQLVVKEASRVRNAQAWELASIERDELRAARIAYASEFPPNADGEPDVGNVHANIRAMKEMIRRIPTTPAEMIAFIGPHFNGMTAEAWDESKFPAAPAGDLSRVEYYVSVHDLLSAFDWADLGKETIDAAIAAKEKA